MKFSTRTVKAIIAKEFKDYYRNPIILIAVFLPTFFTIFYSNMFNNSFLKILCINSNIIFCGLFIPPYLITEEKENNTLDALILFSVNSFEFLIGKILPYIFLSLFANLLALLFILKLDFVNFLQILFLIFISLIGLILVGTLVGFIFMFSKRLFT